ncbi:accessory factor UbiK family protein [Marinibactrum halimedae]|uniref:Ubiquinone biosynthesis accessory factor UbiK n=1 Tax=Marinibactrum halimedae TaxID=1444977 RepID=A0AA37T589_9GAMM|nr:accessory factor UbiK family protein [Marinibactrum halimedae]MCD9458284.1 accessory factor UbiK family protein [Marinibactrum halimedae]GLS27089.1 hypothetical protein GCM10007877_28080 [Marinibactrum halimedae]
MLKNLAKQLADELASVKAPTDNTALQRLVEGILKKHNVVTRSEFDAQTAVLQHTRQRLEAAQQQLDTLSKTNSDPTP